MSKMANEVEDQLTLPQELWANSGTEHCALTVRVVKVIEYSLACSLE